MKIEFNKLKSEDKRYVLTNKKNGVLTSVLMIGIGATIYSVRSPLLAAIALIFGGVYFHYSWKKIKKLDEEYLKYAAKENIVELD